MRALKNLATVASLILLPVLAMAGPARAEAGLDQRTLDTVEKIFADWRLDAHVPGLVYGIVQDGRLVAVKGIGTQDVPARQPVTAGSLFRIASMSKAFTALAILKLRDEGKLLLDAPAETYVPELRDWTYPTTDSRRIRVRDLLNHSAGFVTDDPWGDRQQPLTEAAFTAMLKQGVPFARAPGLTMEYSNFGYALLGRIVTNVSGQPYQDYIRASIMVPLGMTSTGYDVFRSPAARRALGYRWQDNGWVREPDMADGVFGAMGGVETSAEDYARWVSFLLSAWPARDGAQSGPVSRTTVREIAEGSNFVQAPMRAREIGGAPCRQARAYGMGWRIVEDCDLGRVITHSGGYPGYGSNVVLLPEKGVGVFAFTNRTYSGATVPVFRAALALAASGDQPDRTVLPGKALEAGYASVKAIWSAGGIDKAKESLAMNFSLDRDAAGWAGRIKALKAEVGQCPATEPVSAVSALEGRFSWVCEHGRIEGRVLLAPVPQPALQALSLDVVQP